MELNIFLIMNRTPTKPLLALSRDELERLAERLGYRAFHGRQIYSWVYGRGVTDFNEMTDLPKKLRNELVRSLNTGTPKLLETAGGDGEDSTTKFLFELEDQNRVEAVYIPYDDKATVCLSSQVGCTYNCSFCASGTIGLQRNLSSAEIVGTFLIIKRYSQLHVGNVVFMGMGEPLANLKAVMAAWSKLTEPEGIGLSRQKVTISTVGLPKKVRLLAEEAYPPKLVFSIGSPHDEIRKQLLPVVGDSSLAENHRAFSEYARQARNRITVALLIADGLNDTADDARALHRWIGKLPAKVNLLRYNHTTGNFAPPKEEKVEAVAAELIRLGRTVVLRKSRGAEVEAACGQLAARSISSKRT